MAIVHLDFGPGELKKGVLLYAYSLPKLTIGIFVTNVLSA
jgi:hypothetical protein